MIGGPLSSHQHGHLTSQQSGKLLTPTITRETRGPSGSAKQGLGLPGSFKALQQEPQAAGDTPGAEGHHQTTHLLISIQGTPALLCAGGEQSPARASDLPLQEKNPQVNTSSSIQSILIQSTSRAHIPHSAGLWVF